MDLSSIMNKGEPEERKSSSPGASRNVPPLGLPGATPGYHHTSAPQHRRPPSSGNPASFASGTPSLTPVQGPGGSQYPFPNQQVPQSPNRPPGQSYPSHHLPQSNPSTARPQSHGYTHAPPITHSTQSGYPPSHSLSHSPTPSSRHSQTPHAVHQSPLSTPYGQPHPSYQQHVQHSQPSTPLGPPNLPYQRTSGHLADLNSPRLGRQHSTTSNGHSAGSPAPHSSSISHILDSPNAHPQPSPHPRRPSELSDGPHRERSVSVSPKTMVPPRPPSMGSRTSSQQEVYSARSSVQPGESHHGHVQAAAHSQSPLVPSHVPQHSSFTGHSPYSARPLAPHVTPGSDSSLSQTHNQPPIQHHSQRMGMNHLLSPTAGSSQQTNGTTAPPPSRKQNSVEAYSNTSPELNMPKAKVGTEDRDTRAQPPPQEQPPQVNSHSPAAKPRLKRLLDSDLSAEPPTKRGRRRKYQEPPIWARLSPLNPKTQGRSQGPNGTTTAKRFPQESAQPNGNPQGQHKPVVNPQTNDPPWQQDPPRDGDLIHARQLLGPWEKSIIYDEPYLDTQRVIQDWLYLQLMKLAHIGNDPMEGAVEIEAKIGQIILKQSDDRLRLPVRSAAVLDDSMNDKIRFESQMPMHAHKAMNDFLNKAVQGSRQPGRVGVEYKHPKYTDTFRTLSPAGYQALPPAFQKHIHGGRELKMRTSTDDQTGQVVARIVKIGVADLHITNPGHDHDCRISINLEANLNRPELAPFDDLVVEPTDDRPAQPNRKKDRMSYKHLASTIDLTRVEVSTALALKFELEVEVDPVLLRQHHQLCHNQQPNAYQDIVGNFVNNATLLMRQREG